LAAFYDQLAACSRAEALRRAQKQVIAGGYTNPYWWAAFQLYDDPARLGL